MKKIFIIVITIIFSNYSFSQLSTVKINDLNLPATPAFVLMDKAPASIEKPASPRALAVSLVNVWQNSGAIEFTPYWFKDRAAYTFEDNLKKKVPVLQTFAISAATAKQDSNTNISAGFRTQLIRIYSASISAQILDQKKKIVDLLTQENPDDIDIAAVNDAKKELNNLQSKVSFNVELAGAYMGQSGPAQALAFAKTGCWLNIRYTPDKFPLDIVVLARYSSANNKVPAGKDSTFFDYGANLSYQDKNFDIEIEYVNRHDITTKLMYDRFALVANYQLTPGIVAVAALGKDFKKVNNIFGILGLKFGISKEFAKLK